MFLNRYAFRFRSASIPLCAPFPPLIDPTAELLHCCTNSTMCSHRLHNLTPVTISKCGIFSRSCYNVRIYAPIARVFSDFRVDYHRKPAAPTPSRFLFHLGDQRDISIRAYQSEFCVCVDYQKTCFGTFLHIYDRLYPVVEEGGGRVLSPRRRSVPLEDDGKLLNRTICALRVMFDLIICRHRRPGVPSKSAVAFYPRRRICSSTIA